MFFIRNYITNFIKTLTFNNDNRLYLLTQLKTVCLRCILLLNTLLLKVYTTPTTAKPNQLLNIFTWDSSKTARGALSAWVPKRTPVDNISKFSDNGVMSSDLLTTFKLGYSALIREIVEVYIRSFSFGFYYIQGCVFLLFIDACITDDEPLWEPIEWSMVQTWILVIFMFGWIGENLIVSRYGSYTGRDKRVWMAWYKTFWLIEVYYIINFAVVAVFVIVPFYFELNYTLSFIYTWWHWYSRVFFFKFISVFSIVLYLSYLLQMSVRWLNWKKGLLLIVIINIFLSYLIYTHFIMSFFGYFTDPVWYQKTRTNDYVQLSHEPSRWGWGPAKKDHFTYHNVKTVFWFKNDGPFASAFLLFHLYLFLSLFFVYIYWITLFRRVYSMKEIPLTYTTYCVSTLKQFFYSFMMIYMFIFLSFITQYWRLPIEFFWGINVTSWWGNLGLILSDYSYFLLSLFTL